MQWIRLTYNGQKNPAEPTRMSFIRSILPANVDSPTGQIRYNN